MITLAAIRAHGATPLAIAILGAALITAAAAGAAALIAMTVQVNGTTCALAEYRERRLGADYVYDVCGNVYICPPAGTEYSPAARLTIPGTCRRDRVYAGRFEP